MSPLGPWRELPHLGVPDGEDLVAHFLSEHGGVSAYRDGDDSPAEGVIRFGGVICPAWPTDEELAAARDRIGEPR